jgi:tryptophan synthase alpha chain
MSRIAEAFAKGKAFIPFITCGDPDLETTAKVVRAAVRAGADLIELGIPFSDPTAEGPVIQEASIRALENGMTTDKAFDFMKEIRKDVKTPIAFVTYANVVFSYGAEKFIAGCREAGVDGLILPDLPYEEKEDFQPLCTQYGIDLISTIAFNSAARIEMIAKEAEGFICLRAMPGATGEADANLAEVAAKIASFTNVPCMVNCGAELPEQAAAAAKIADGVIVDEAMVHLFEQYGKDAPAKVGEYVKALKDAIR